MNVFNIAAPAKSTVAIAAVADTNSRTGFMDASGFFCQSDEEFQADIQHCGATLADLMDASYVQLKLAA